MSGTRTILELFSWLQTAFHVVIALAFAIFCFVRARKVGTAGASLLAAVAVVDVLTLVVYRIATLAVSAAHGSMNTAEGVFSALGAMNVFFDLVSIGLVGGAYFLLRKAPASTT